MSLQMTLSSRRSLAGTTHFATINAKLSNFVHEKKITNIEALLSYYKIKCDFFSLLSNEKFPFNCITRLKKIQPLKKKLK